MSERSFVIREVLSAETNSGQGTITLSEFHRRIDLAFRAAFCALDEKFDYAKAVEIIVNGEGEKAEYHCEDCGKPMTKAEGGDTFTVCEKCWDKHYKRKPKKPSPAPTREEWKLWIQDLPRFNPAGISMDAWLDKIEIWLENGPWMKMK